MERQGRRKTASFSASLLDAIYQSIDSQDGEHRRNNAATVEDEIESLRRAIMVEKWMENYSSSSSGDSSVFSETDSSSKAAPKREGRFTRTKSRAMKIYGDFKKAKEPSSPGGGGGRFSSFLNSIFSPRIHVKKSGADTDDFRHVRKSRSMKDTVTTTTTATTTTSSSSASCLIKNRSTGAAAKSKRSVRFCPVSVILDEDSRHKTTTHGNDVVIGSHFVKKNLNSFGKTNPRRRELRDFYDDNDSDLDDRSCASSDLFELENIGHVGMYEQELPVYGTTSVKMHHAIAANRRIF